MRVMKITTKMAYKGLFSPKQSLIFLCLALIHKFVLILLFVKGYWSFIDSDEILRKEIYIESATSLHESIENASTPRTGSCIPFNQSGLKLVETLRSHNHGKLLVSHSNA